MTDDDYPALYVASNSAAMQAQAWLLNAQILSSGLLIGATALALFSPTSSGVALASGMLFFASLFIHIYIQYQGFQKKWYKARALAESVKTATWRFMMRAEPFQASEFATATAAFRKLLEELLAENTDIGHQLSGEEAGGDQITQRMAQVWHGDFDAKRKLYHDERIKDQHSWYARKSGVNKRLSRRWFGITSSLYSVAGGLVLVRISNPELHFLPIEVFAVAASSAIGWTQIKRYDELASAYGLTAHEIGIINTRFGSVGSTDDLTKFVSDAENAFSREHTQWAARRDHAA